MPPTASPAPLHEHAFEVLRDLRTLVDADEADLDQQQITLLRKMFEDPTVGLYLFALEVFGYSTIKPPFEPSLHLPICQFLGQWGRSNLTDGSTIWHSPEDSDAPVAESWRRLMVCIPRDCYKTSLCTRANSLWQICKNPNATIGIFHENEKKVEMWVGAICEVVERSRLFQTLWRDLLPPGISYIDKEKGRTLPRKWKWGASGMLFQRDSYGIAELSIQGFGIGGAAQGYHFTHKILDDIIGKNAAYSDAVMKEAIDWVDNSRPLERPAEKGCELVVHTPWAYHDVYAHMLKRWPGEYKVYKRHLLEDTEGRPDHVDGQSIFPAKFTTEEAKKLLKTDFYVNMAQYQCEPRVGRDQSFTEEWFRFGQLIGSTQRPIWKYKDDYFDPEILDPECGDDRAPQLVPLHWFEKAVILDPAPSKSNEVKREPRANNGITVVGVDPWGRRVCFEAWSGRESPTERLKRLMALCEKWGASTISVEEVVFSAEIGPLYEAIIRHEYDWSPEFRPCFPQGRDKHARIKMNLISPMENGYWYFNHTGCGRLVQELGEFPNGETIDLIDALSYTDEVVSRPETPDEQEDLMEARRSLERNLGMTGYGEFQEESHHAP